MKQYLLLLFILLASCVTATAQSYFSNAVNSPGLPARYVYGQQYPHITALSLLAGTSGYDAQAILQWHPQLGIMINATHFNHRDNRQQLLEAGLGYSGMLDRNARSSASIYLGIGQGSTESLAGSFSLFGSVVESGYRGKFIRYFVQPEASFRQKSMEFSIAARTIYLRYIPHDQSGESLSQKDGHWLYEPAFTFRLGNPEGESRLVFQLGLMMGSEPVIQDPFRFSLGYQWKPSPRVRRINAADFF